MVELIRTAATIASIFVAVIFVAAVVNAWWLRSGGRSAPTPPGFRLLSWGAAARVAVTQQLWPIIVVSLSVIPGLGHLLLGRPRRAAAYAAVAVATLVAFVVVANTSGLCSCEPAGRTARLAIVSGFVLVLGLIQLASVIATSRLATRRLTFRALGQAVQNIARGEAGQPTCPRCRAASRSGAGFCDTCAGELASGELSLSDPRVRATALGATDGDPTLQRYRSGRIVLGSIGGESAAMGARMESLYVKRLRRLLGRYEQIDEQAWLDPQAPERLWVIQRLNWVSHEGDAAVARFVVLHIFGEAGLQASWTVATLSYEERRASSSSAPIAAPAVAR